MKVIIAKSSGFCMGVRRAVEMVLDAAVDTTGPVYTFGPLIHNPQVLAVLEEKGIRIMNKVPEQGAGTVLIRAHGVPPQIKERLQSAGFQLLDATCPRVVKIQAIIRKYARNNHEIIIFGDQNHPEVVGLLGYANGNGHVVEGLEQFQALPPFDQAVVVAQTTQNSRTMTALKEYVQSTYPHYKVFETICDSTERRQAEIKKLSETVAAVLVVGGRNSGNTRRLAQIAGISGKPVFHVETEADLDQVDLDRLAASSSVGITAGASTPNWIINKVYRTMEGLGYKRARRWRRQLFNLQRLLLLTNILVSIGAGCLVYASNRLMGIKPAWPLLVIPVLYVQSMHLLNHLTGTMADKYNDPVRADFYERNRTKLTVSALMASSAGLFTALKLGIWPFLLLLAMSVMGVSYNLRLVPGNLGAPGKGRIRDIPGSKTILIALAWGVLAAVLPPLAVHNRLEWIDLFLFAWFTGLVFVRTSFFDVLDMQGDRLIGKETIAIMLGEKRTLRMLAIILTALIVLLPLAGVCHLISGLGFVLALCPLLMLTIVVLYRKRALMPGIRLEFLVESLFILAGILAFLWPSIH